MDGHEGENVDTADDVLGMLGGVDVPKGNEDALGGTDGEEHAMGETVGGLSGGERRSSMEGHEGENVHMANVLGMLGGVDVPKGNEDALEGTDGEEHAMRETVGGLSGGERSSSIEGHEGENVDTADDVLGMLGGVDVPKGNEDALGGTDEEKHAVRETVGGLSGGERRSSLEEHEGENVDKADDVLGMLGGVDVPKGNEDTLGGTDGEEHAIGQTVGGLSGGERVRCATQTNKPRGWELRELVHVEPGSVFEISGVSWGVGTSESRGIGMAETARKDQHCGKPGERSSRFGEILRVKQESKDDESEGKYSDDHEKVNKVERAAENKGEQTVGMKVEEESSVQNRKSDQDGETFRKSDQDGETNRKSNQHCATKRKADQDGATNRKSNQHGATKRKAYGLLEGETRKEIADKGELDAELMDTPAAAATTPMEEEDDLEICAVSSEASGKGDLRQRKHRARLRARLPRCSHCMTRFQPQQTAFKNKHSQDLLCSHACVVKFFDRLYAQGKLQPRRCAGCHREMQPGGKQSVVAEVPDGDTFLEFCSSGCLSRHEEGNAVTGVAKPFVGGDVSGKLSQARHETMLPSGSRHLCSDSSLQFHREGLQPPVSNISTTTVATNTAATTTTCTTTTTSQRLFLILPKATSRRSLPSTPDHPSPSSFPTHQPPTPPSYSSPHPRPIAGPSITESYPLPTVASATAPQEHLTTSTQDPVTISLKCAHCQSEFSATTSVLVWQEGMLQFCSTACRDEFKRVHGVPGPCDTYGQEKTLRDTQTSGGARRAFCSDADVNGDADVQTRWTSVQPNHRAGTTRPPQKNKAVLCRPQCDDKQTQAGQGWGFMMDQRSRGELLEMMREQLEGIGRVRAERRELETSFLDFVKREHAAKMENVKLQRELLQSEKELLEMKRELVVLEREKFQRNKGWKMEVEQED